ncbi:nuclear transport factor 2 family protein [Steroidobacter sp. S1-65]|uniref:Nuclear transport factor 2 family protein n=1 Tax=Steroidobacter gossypii TaxID=2805490 RepID=A0ABS1WQL7_9GAMM|nr:nuclear transport factor 2 family protein [Steroidobacter gossypii]MBM0103258.1 nuclear transport factor 2 family protein [Steroidobacter gossypii]
MAHDIEARNKDVIRKAFAAWAAGTGGPFELLTPEATWTIVGRSVAAKTYPNRAAFISEVIAPFNARMRERLVPTVHEILADGDKVLVFFDARATTHDGTPYTNTYAWLLTMRDEMIVNATAFFDSIAFDELWHRVQPRESGAR